MLSHRWKHIHILVFHYSKISNNHHHHNCNQHSCFPCYRSDLQLMYNCTLEVMTNDKNCSCIAWGKEIKIKLKKNQLHTKTTMKPYTYPYSKKKIPPLLNLTSWSFQKLFFYKLNLALPCLYFKVLLLSRFWL